MRTASGEEDDMSEFGTRVICATCKRLVGVTRAGRVRPHKDNERKDCAGSLYDLASALPAHVQR